MDASLDPQIIGVVVAVKTIFVGWLSVTLNALEQTWNIGYNFISSSNNST
jgi:hypothetical protein